MGKERGKREERFLAPLGMTGGGRGKLETRRQKLEKQFGGDVEAAAEAFDVVFVEVALAA